MDYAGTSDVHDGLNTHANQTIECALDHPYPSPEGEDPYKDGTFVTELPSEWHGSKQDNGGINSPEGDLESDTWTFQCLKTLTSHQPGDVGPWKRHVEAEGHTYYYLTKGEPRFFSYLTEHDVSRPDIQSELEWFIAWLEQRARELPEEERSRIPTNAEVVLKTNAEHRRDDKDAEWTYYMADIESQTIFYLHDLEIPRIMLPPVKSGMQECICHFFAIEYWMHVREFPSHRKPNRETEQVLGILSSYLLDDALELRNDEDALFDTQDMRMSLGFIRDLHSVQDRKRPSGYLMSCIATVMLVLERDRFRKLAGNVREDGRTWLAKLLLPLLLFQPGSILRHFERMFKDKLVSKQEWAALQKKLEKESSTFVIYATVLLAVDISYLAVPTVLGMINSQPLPSDQTTLPSLLGQVSIIVCLGSIIIGILQEHIKVDSKPSMLEMHSRLDINQFPQTRLEILAIQFSLPFALLLWGILAFSISVLILCFDASVTVVGIATRRIVFGSVCGIVGILAVWTWATGLQVSSSTGWPWFEPAAEKKCEPQDIEMKERNQDLGRGEDIPESASSMKTQDPPAVTTMEQYSGGSSASADSIV